MPSFDQLARSQTNLDDEEIAHLQRLVGSWSLLCDLSFADLLLHVEVDGDQSAFVTVGHRRSVTGPTVRQRDPVGTITESSSQPLMARAILQGRQFEGLAPFPNPALVSMSDEVVEEAIGQPLFGSRVVVEYVPVRFGERQIAVMTRESAPSLMRQPSLLERTYRNVWQRLAEMVMSGEFPSATREGAGEYREPRVGDGCVLLDREGRIEFASPNAVSAFHRLGVAENPGRHTLGELGIDDSVVSRGFASHHSTVAELQLGQELSVIVRCHPLLESGRATGALLLTRDISELRIRDRLLLSRDVTIREINHRVKNNLQTIQALLRMQARRASSADAKSAISDSARRVGAIALAHEKLSADAADEVDFDDVVAGILGMIEVGTGSLDAPPRVTVVGRLGTLPGEFAMPLAVVLAELVQNSIDHAGHDCVVSVDLEATSHQLRLRVVDDGPGLPDGYSLDRDAGLGLTIVRTLVVQDLGGAISIQSRSGGPMGCEVEVKVPRVTSPMPLG